jgi:hypothetical protein
MSGLPALPTDNFSPDVYFLSQLTPTNHAGVVWVVASISLIYALLASGVRFTLRYRMYGFDDSALLVSTLACVVQHAFIFIALINGLGNPALGSRPERRDALANVCLIHRMIRALADRDYQSTYTRIILFFVVHYLAKISLILFTRRLFTGQDWYNRVICDALFVMSCACCIISIMLMSIECQSGWYFATTDVCPHLVTRVERNL